MVLHYTGKGSQLRPAKISPTVYRSIGRLVRACAELEDIITLFLFDITRVGNGAGRALLGRTPASSRIQIAQGFLEKKDPVQGALKTTFLSPRYEAVSQCRNAVAHGTLIGVDELGRLAFQTETRTESLVDQVAIKVIAYTPVGIATLALQAEAMVPEFEKALGLEELRKRRHAPRVQEREYPQARTQKSAAVPRPRDGGRRRSSGSARC